MLDNGIELSIVAGPGMYSLPRDAGNSPDDFDKFEVAVFDDGGILLKVMLVKYQDGNREVILII